MEHLNPCAGLKRENMAEIKEGEIREGAGEVDGLGKGGDSSGRERGKQLFASPARDGVVATVSTNTGEVSNRQETEGAVGGGGRDKVEDVREATLSQAGETVMQLSRGGITGR